MSKLSAHDVVGNCRIGFDAAESLGIPRVIEPRDMNMLTVPDKLAVMTYLHQLRAHFTGKQLKIEQIGERVLKNGHYNIINKQKKCFFFRFNGRRVELRYWRLQVGQFVAESH